MAIKHYKPTTPGHRNMTVLDYSELSKVAPEKSLLAPVKKNAGRNSYGRITVRHRGGGNRKKYRIIDFKRLRFGEVAEVKTLEYDPNRSAFIALIQYEDGSKSYIIAPNGLKVGDKVESGPNADIKIGNALPLTNIPVGTFLHNIELYLLLNVIFLIYQESSKDLILRKHNESHESHSVLLHIQDILLNSLSSLL